MGENIRKKTHQKAIILKDILPAQQEFLLPWWHKRVQKKTEKGYRPLLSRGICVHYFSSSSLNWMRWHFYHYVILQIRKMRFWGFMKLTQEHPVNVLYRENLKSDSLTLHLVSKQLPNTQKGCPWDSFHLMQLPCRVAFGH